MKQPRKQKQNFRVFNELIIFYGFFVVEYKLYVPSFLISSSIFSKSKKSLDVVARISELKLLIYFSKELLFNLVSKCLYVAISILKLLSEICTKPFCLILKTEPITAFLVKCELTDLLSLTRLLIPLTSCSTYSSTSLNLVILIGRALFYRSHIY